MYTTVLINNFVETIHEILLAFSAYTNGKRIINVTQQPGQISFFNGLKVISMFWIILGHRFAASVDLIVNKADATEVSIFSWIVDLILYFLFVVASNRPFGIRFPGTTGCRHFLFHFWSAVSLCIFKDCQKNGSKV